MSEFESEKKLENNEENPQEQSWSPSPEDSSSPSEENPQEQPTASTRGWSNPPPPHQPANGYHQYGYGFQNGTYRPASPSDSDAGKYPPPPHQTPPAGSHTYIPNNGVSYHGSVYTEQSGEWKNSTNQLNNEEPYQWKFEDYEKSAPSVSSLPPKKRNRGLVVFGAILGSVLLLAVFAFIGLATWSIMHNSIVDGEPSVNSSSSSPLSSESEVNGLAVTERPRQEISNSNGGPLTNQEIAKKVKPSVVGIIQYSSMQSLLNPTQGTSQGSGIIMEADGYIITNAHVVDGARGLKVVLNSGEVYEARLIGSDTKTDLAVIKIDATDLPYAEFGDSTILEVGEPVLAIGNPGGLELAGSVTHGIVSAVERPVRTNNNNIVMNCIQTDAPINPGNSGGALVNQYGQVVGINSSKISNVQYEGIGFAIPIHEAKPIIDDLKAFGMVKGRAKIGVTLYPVDSYTARMYGVPTGVIIVSTEPDSDVAAKGVISGDIITHIDGQEIFSHGDVTEILEKKKPGDTIELTIFRQNTSQNSRTFRVSVVLMEDHGTTTSQPDSQPVQ